MDKKKLTLLIMLPIFTLTSLPTQAVTKKAPAKHQKKIVCRTKAQPKKVFVKTSCKLAVPKKKTPTNAPLKVNFTSLLLVNRTHTLPANYVPFNLVKVTVPANKAGMQLNRTTHASLINLFAAAKKAGHQLLAISCFRDYAYQNNLYQASLKKFGQAHTNKYVAAPGKSEHQTGLAIDIGLQGNSLSVNFGQTAAGKWLKSNAPKFGFILRYPQGKERITGYNYEPWHFRFVKDAETAKAIIAAGTLEEYLA
ncbi:MAG: hypothetical protein RLZ12_179, partial [Bacillota bacterium]